MAKRTASSKLSRKVASRKKRKSRPLKKRSNPSAAAATGDGFFSHTWAELATMALPGIVGYAGSRGAGHLAYRVVRSRSPKMAKFAGPIGSVLFALGASYATKRYESLQKYDLPVIVGAWIGAGQSVLETFFPALAWPLGDWNMAEYLAAPKRAARQMANGRHAEQLGEYDKAYSEAFGPDEDAEPLPEATGDDNFADIPGLNDQGMKTGIFAGGLAN